MRPTMTPLCSSAVAASFLLLQPVQAQAPAQPAASAAAADAADTQQQKAAAGADGRDQPAEAPAPWSSSRDWPSKADPSDLKAKNSETAVEQMEAPPSRIEICDTSAEPKADCADQQPPRRKPRPSEKRKPR